MSRSSRAIFRIRPYLAIPFIVALLAAVLYLVNRAAVAQEFLNEFAKLWKQAGGN